MYKALYLHIPFCKQRCAYCDFTTAAIAGDDPAIDEYLLDLESEIKQAAQCGDLAQIQTLYIGGGTPTHLGHDRLVRLALLLAHSLDVASLQEYTLEANPESLSLEICTDLAALGVNRLSLGVQSFVDSELASLGRIHDAARAKQALAQARSVFTNISLDLICGIPAQTSESWQYSLEQALALAPEHLSIYPLQLEAGTELYESLQTGRISEPLPDEDEQADFMEQAARMLAANGYERYEVASYAKPGFASKHNSCYWLGLDYLGLGRGAASMKTLADGGRQRWFDGESAEILTAREACAEDLMLAMRMKSGVSVLKLEEASRLLPTVGEVFLELQQLGLVDYVADAVAGYQPSEKGWLLGNELYTRIWSLAG